MDMEVDPSASEFITDSLSNIQMDLEFNKPPSDPMFKFISGEISLDDYLSRMEELSAGNDLKVDDPETVVESEEVETTDTTSLAESDSSDISDFGYIPSSVSESEDETETFDSRPKKQSKRGRKRSKLSPTLRGLMGQANVCYAQGDTENAVKMCLEIIKEAPKASEPYKTLASVYEEIGQHEKSLQMRLIAAHLGPASKDEWVELAGVLQRKDDYRQAVLCLTRAINLDPLNVTLFDARADLMKKANVTCVDAYGYPRLLHKLNVKKCGPAVVHLCKKISQIYYSEKKIDKALATLKYAFDKCPDLITVAEANLYLDVLTMARDFKECHRVLTEFCNIHLNQITRDDGFFVTECIVPEDLPADIRAKLILMLIFTNSMECAKTEIDILLTEDPEEIGDLFWDVGLMLFEKKQFHEAINVLTPLINTKNFNSINLWFKLTQCYKDMNQIEDCLQCYRKALEFFPEHSELKLKFCDELMDVQMYQEAIEVTLSDGNDLSVLIHERCKLYLLVEDYDNFLKTGWQLFRLHCKEITTLEDYLVFTSVFSQQKGMSSVLSQSVPSTVDTSVSLEDEWKIFLKMCQLYIERMEYDTFLLLTTSLYVSFKFIPLRNELRMAMMVACSMNNNYELGFDLVRDIIHSKKVDSDRVWNTLNLCSMKTESSRLHKFLIRFLLSHPKEHRAVMLYANNSLVSGSFKYALNDYSLLYQKFKTPLLALVLGITLSHISCQKYTTNKHALVSQAVVFFSKYRQLRGDDALQEVYYNTGRLFHQLELLPQAIFYYKKALECDAALHSDITELKCDIAYNLHLIYLSSDQPNLANVYLHKYVVI